MTAQVTTPRSRYRRHLVRAALAAPLLAPVARASAQAAWPSRPLRIIVPYGVGGASDLTTRMAAAKLAEDLKQSVVVENRPGGGSIVGVNALKNAAPDGYTLGLVVSANAALPWLRTDVPFDVRKDFVLLTSLYVGPLVLTVPASFPARTLPEFVAHVKANPDRILAGSLGAGTTTHLAAELLNQIAGTTLTNVSFKASGEIHAAVLAGTVHAAFDNFGTPKPLIESGKVRALAVTGRRRTAALPNVPAIAEFYPDYEMVSWTGFAAPLGTPEPIVERLAAGLRTAMQDPALRTYIADVVGAEAGGGTPAELRKRIVDDYEMFGRVIRKAGIKLD